MFDELLVGDFICIRTIERLLQESKEHRDDDRCFQSLAKDNEEHRNCEDVDCHVSYSLSNQSMLSVDSELNVGETGGDAL